MDASSQALVAFCLAISAVGHADLSPNGEEERLAAGSWVMVVQGFGYKMVLQRYSN